MHRPVVAEVNLNAIESNVAAIRKAVGSGVRILPAVKADGYGHGAVRVSRAALRAGADMLGVASVDEALELRDAGITAPILVFGCTAPESAEEVVRFGISTTVCDPGYARALAHKAAQLGKKASVHVKVDTGMGRIGVGVENAADLVLGLIELPSLDVDGIFTHFPSADEKERTFTEHQIMTFKSLLADLDTKGVRPGLAHAANSGAILNFPQAYFDLVRPGIMFYGLYPSPDSARRIHLTPALTFKTRIVFLKDLPAGKTVSYGRMFAASRTTRVATLAVGYADGYSRLLSNRGGVSVRGCRAPVIGRVCMDQIMVDVTDVPSVEVGDEVILFGGGRDFLTVEQIAEMIGTIPHDVCCAIGKRVPRIYVESR